MISRYIPSIVLCLGLLFVLTAPNVHSQSFLSEAESNGFTLKKVVSDTAIATGDNFSYTIYFSIPAGASSVTITDVLPPAVSFQAISVTAACGAPTVSTPTVGSSGGTVSLNWASVPSGCSGSFVITVNFPNGVTCDGTSARNRVCLMGELGPVPVDFCTGYVATTANAEDPWNIGKWILGAGSQPGPCNKVTADSVVTYRICVWKDVGTTGQLNLDNAVITDTLPPGAMLVSSTCGMTQTGNVLTWNAGALSALPMYNTQCCTFEVLYPSTLFPTGSQITNSATLRGTLGSGNNPCGPALHTSNKTCIEIKQLTSATFSKYVYTNGQPGCAGKYRIWLCNNGSLPISTMNITDTIPSDLDSIMLGTVSSGITASLTGNTLTASLSSPLLPTQCRLIEIEFVIPPTATPGSTITNCANLVIPGMPPRQTCATFTVNAPAAKPCIRKEICDEQPSYSPGDVFRYRLRVQNIGGLPITGATVTDILDPNLVYAGNLATYTTSTWSAPCQTTSNWSGVTLTQTGNTLNFALPTIPASCQDLFYTYCGMYGNAGVPFYFIEFDVMVSDTAALGNIPNRFTIGGGTVTSTVTSNTEYVNVVGTAGFTLDKGVAADTTSWASSIAVPAPSSVNYQLRFTVAPGSVGLRHITFADLLPRDDPPNDQLILGPCTPRGSVFDVNFNSTVSTSPLAAEYNNPLTFAAVNTFTPAGAPGAMFLGGCGTAGTWASGLVPGDDNLGYYFGSTPLGGGSSATSVVNVSIPPSASEPDSACNTFAANAAVRHLINSTTINDVPVGELESGAACIHIEEGHVSKDTCFSAQVKSVTASGVDAVGDCMYTVVLTVTNPTISPLIGWFDSDQGAVTPPTLTLPSGTSTQTLTFTDTAPADSIVCIRYGIIDQMQQRVLCDSVCFDIEPCDEETPCDSLINGVLDSACCEYDVTIVNAVGSPITSISYTIVGGTVDMISTAPCAPVTPATAGSSSGVLTYSPPCAGSMGFSIQATPSTPGGTITVQLVIHHGQKDSCRVEFSYACKEEQQHEPIKCDKVKVKPFLFTGLNLSGRTFIVQNTKVPTSPITYIDINPVAVPCFLQGGGLLVDFVPTTWTIPYTRIPVTGFISANTQVRFNLGVDYTCAWTGTINLTIHHADGDSCTYSYGPWDASPPTTGGGVISTTGIAQKVYANRLRLQNTNASKAVKYVSVNVESDTSVIVAGSGDHWEGSMLEAGAELLDGYEQGRTEALFSFAMPISPGSTSDFFNLVVARDSSRSEAPVIRWVTYDEDGNALDTDTVRITTPVLSIRGEGGVPAPGEFRLLQYFPSPAGDAATINYVLGKDLDVRLELYDKLGRYLETIEQGFTPRGMRSLRYSTAHLPTGNYYLRLSSGSEQVTRPLVIMR